MRLRLSPSESMPLPHDRKIARMSPAMVGDIHATSEGVSEKFPDEILVGLNDRNPQLHDIYRVNLKTGDRKLIQENPGYAAFITDDMVLHQDVTALREYIRR